MNEIKNCEDVLKNMLSEKKVIHSKNVAKKAEFLAKTYKLDVELAKISGLLHDITKELSQSEHLEIIKKFKIPVDSLTKHVLPELLHAHTGSAYAKRVLKINDENVLNAIKFHTVGRENMSSLEKIVYIADMISEERDYPGVENLRLVAAQNLDLALVMCIRTSINFLMNKNKIIHKNTFEAYNYAVTSFG